MQDDRTDYAGFLPMPSDERFGRSWLRRHRLWRHTDTVDPLFNELDGLAARCSEIP
jgi:hypothetical protein